MKKGATYSVTKGAANRAGSACRPILSLHGTAYEGKGGYWRFLHVSY